MLAIHLTALLALAALLVLLIRTLFALSALLLLLTWVGLLRVVRLLRRSVVLVVLIVVGHEKSPLVSAPPGGAAHMTNGPDSGLFRNRSSRIGEVWVGSPTDQTARLIAVIGTGGARI